MRERYIKTLLIDLNKKEVVYVLGSGYHKSEEIEKEISERTGLQKDIRNIGYGVWVNVIDEKEVLDIVAESEYRDWIEDIEPYYYVDSVEFTMRVRTYKVLKEMGYTHID